MKHNFFAGSVDDAETDCFGGASPPSPKRGTEREQKKRTNIKAKNMQKFVVASFSLLAILLISVTPFLDSFGIKSAEASNQISIQWGHLTPVYNETERYYADLACYAVNWYFENDYSSDYYTENAYWTDTTDDYLDDCMGIQNDPGYDVDFVTNWWVGDFFADGTPPNPFGHFWCYGDNGNHISDYWVRYCATDGGTISSKQYFNFIWTCSNGGLYWYDNNGNSYTIPGIWYAIPTASPAPTNTNDEYGFLYNGISAVGMPYAWTGRIDMDTNGYGSSSGDYCYIGFESNSPFMSDPLPGTAVLSVDFPDYFYQYMLGWRYPYLHRTVSYSLDSASILTYGVPFDETDLYNGYWRPAGSGLYWRCHMRVFGNGALQLPH